MIELRDSPGKGRGLFATEDIQKGRRILSEQPLVALPAGSQGSNLLWKELESMTIDQKTKYGNLHGAEETVGPLLRNDIYSRLALTTEEDQLQEAFAKELHLH